MVQAQGIVVLESVDFILTPIYFILLLALAFAIRNSTVRQPQLRPYFIYGLLVKLLGGLGMGAVYAFYYDGGDTFYYFFDSKAFDIAMKDGVGPFFRLLFLPAGAVTVETVNYTNWLTYFKDPAAWMAVKVYGVISLLSFHSYWVMTLIISALSFTGVWAMFRTFVNLYPNLHRQLAYCILFVPSVFFWGSGILKDSISFGCIGWITYASYQIFFRQKGIISNALIMVFVGYIALEVKAYIIISFLPALLFWIFLTYRSRIGVKFARVALGPVVFAVSVLFGFLMVQRLGEEFSKFSLQNVANTMHNFQLWHSYLAEHEKASGYSLGSLDGSVSSMVKVFPRAVFVTLYQPFLWQAHSAVMLLSALESLFILFFTLYIFKKNGIKRTLQAIWGNPTVFFCFFFSILFSFCVGLTAYNFGALVRYKIPCIPFYLVGLVVLNHLTAIDRKRIEEEKQAEKLARKNRRRPATALANVS
jgi:hypothetical protein